MDYMCEVHIIQKTQPGSSDMRKRHAENGIISSILSESERVKLREGDT